jgi:hypothetical protein
MITIQFPMILYQSNYFFNYLNSFLNENNLTQISKKEKLKRDNDFFCQKEVTIEPDSSPSSKNSYEFSFFVDNLSYEEEDEDDDVIKNFFRIEETNAFTPCIREAEISLDNFVNEVLDYI